MEKEQRRSESVAETMARAGTMTRRGFVKVVTFGAGAVLAAGPAALRLRDAGAQDQVTIKQWYHQYGEDGTQEAAFGYAEKFTAANPTIKVEVTWVPGDYGAALNAALLTDDGPDVYETQLNFALVKAGQVTALDDLYPADVKADFHPNTLAENT